MSKLSAEAQWVMEQVKGDPEFALRVDALLRPDTRPQIFGPEDAAPLCTSLVGGFTTERLGVLALNRKHRVISSTVLTIGNDGFTVVCPKQIYRWALLQGRSGAASIILTHNHPSGDPTPSPQDRDVTRRVLRAGEILGVKLVDHIIIGAAGRWARCGEYE